MTLNSFRCSATAILSIIFKLKSLCIKWTLLAADGFSYMLDKVARTSLVDFTFVVWNATLRDRDSLMILSAFLSMRFQPRPILYQWGNPRSAFSRIQNRIHQTCQFELYRSWLPLNQRTLALIPVVVKFVPNPQETQTQFVPVWTRN